MEKDKLIRLLTELKVSYKITRVWRTSFIEVEEGGIEILFKHFAKQRTRLFFLALLIGVVIGIANGIVIGVVCF